MQVDIYFNEEKLDTFASTKIAETKQINDFLDVKDRQTSYTNTFKLPKTERNKALLGGMGIVGNTSLTPYRVHNVDIFRNGIQTISKGIGYFRNTNDTYNVYVYSENIDLFVVMGDKTLSDMNLNGLSHVLNIGSWRQSFNRNDYVYAIADYGKTDDNTIELDYQVPSLYVKYLWEKMFYENGFNFKYVGRGHKNDYNPFSKDEWKKLILTIDQGLHEPEASLNPILKLSARSDKISDYDTHTVNNFGQRIVVQQLPEVITEYIHLISSDDPDNMLMLSSSLLYNRSRIRIKESGFYKISIGGVFYNHNTENAAMYVEKDGHNLFVINDSFNAGQNAISFNEKVYFRQGDEILIKTVTLPKNNRSNYAIDLNVNIWLDNSVKQVNFNSHLTEIKQMDFFKDVVQYYGLVFRRKGKTYEFISLEELLDPLAEYENYNAIEDGTVYDDWSKKFNKIISIDSKIGKYAQNNLLKYRYVNQNNTYANGNIKVDDQTLEDETTIVKRPYRAPDISSVIVRGNGKSKRLSYCPLYEKELNDDGTIKKVKAVKAEPYFGKVETLYIPVSYKLSGAIGRNTHYTPAVFMSFDDLDMTNVVTNRYATFSNTINYGLKYTVELNLNVLDVHTLDFFKLKYLKQLGGLFYLNKISNFTGTGATKTELIRVRAFEKLGDFSDDFNNDFNI